MFKDIDEYLNRLKKELSGSDPALVQDALSDAEEHLRSALEESLAGAPGITEAETLSSLIERYGTPAEVASAYREIESRFPVAFPPAPSGEKQSSWRRFFGALTDARAWSALLYMLLSALTGCIYGMWILFGASLSLCSLVFIIGIPVTGLFLLSIRGIALIEGRIVEALLGIRMPRKPLFVRRGLSWIDRFKALVTESHSWKAMAYMIIHFPLGLAYGTGILILMAAAVKCSIYPLWYFILGRPLINLDSGPIFAPIWTFPLISIAGILLWVLIVHLARWIGKVQSQFAKSMLVSK